MLKRYRQLIPTIILVALCISTTITAIEGVVTLNGSDYDFALSPKHYGAFIAVLATGASFFFLRKYYRYFFVLTCGLGVIDLINFTALQTTWGIRFGDTVVGLSPALLLVGVATYSLNYQGVNTFLFSLIKPSDQKIAEIQREEIADFKGRFSPKSTQELKQIVTANKLVPSALSAARQLLNERQ